MDIRQLIRTCQKEVRQVIDVDQATLDCLLLPIICDGHAVLHGMIGTGKTAVVMALAKTLGLEFGMYQCHSETIPSDLEGFEKYNQKTHEFEIRKGPLLLYNLFLVDEINRMPPRAQAALLGPMAQGKVTIGNETLNVPCPFTVYATQNPIETQGVYPLAEAQIDRFMMQIPFPYHSYDATRKLLSYANAAATHARIEQLPVILSKEAILEARREVKEVALGDAWRWITSLYLCCCTQAELNGRAPRGWKPPELTEQCVRVGCSPRGARDLAQAARGLAYLEGTPIRREHIERLAVPVLRHRLVLKRMLPEDYRGLAAAQQVDKFLADVMPEALDRANRLPEPC
ncbi:MAG TPA: AAA family ATPase [Planctomycetaceae bacterium]|nr:AAA family ATPase [Planctomycetaceae bacterium]